MATQDYRKNPDQYPSFYVFNDLRFPQNRDTVQDYPKDNPGISRYSTLEEAVSGLKNTPSYMTPALGIAMSNMSELDLIHRREGEMILIQDYKRYPLYRNDPAVDGIVKNLCKALHVEWQSEPEIIKDSPILAPLSLPGLVNTPMSSYLDDKDLRVEAPRPDIVNPLYAIKEVYSPETGWIPFDAFFRMAEEYGFNNPHIPRAAQFSVAYNHGEEYGGQADITVEEYKMLAERYYVTHGTEEQVKKAVNDLADALFAFMKDHDPYEYKDQVPDEDAAEYQLSAIRNQLLCGDIKDFKDTLKDIVNEPADDAEKKRACDLLRRLSTFSKRRMRKSLSQKILSAQNMASVQEPHKDGQNKSAKLEK